MKQTRTRGAVNCDILGTPKHLLWLERFANLAANSNGKTSLKETVQKVKNIWFKRNIPTLSDQRVFVLISQQQKMRQDVNKSIIRSKNSSKFKDKLTKFHETCEKLLDIAARKCIYRCSCDKKKKVSPMQKKIIKKKISCYFCQCLYMYLCIPYILFGTRNRAHVFIRPT